MLECHAVTLPIQESARVGRKVNIMHLAKFRNRTSAPKCIVYQPRDDQTSCKVLLASVERHRCSNEANTQNPLKFAGVPQTPEPISVASGPTFAILWKHMEEILLFNNSFPDCRYVSQLRRYSPTKLCVGAQMAIFLRHFCVLYFHRAACSTFQTCILNSH